MSKRAPLIGVTALAIAAGLAVWSQLGNPAVADQDPLPDQAELLKSRFETMTSVAIAVEFEGSMFESNYGTFFGDGQGNFAYVARDNARTHTLIAGQLLTHHTRWGEGFDPVLRQAHQWMAQPIADFWPALINGDLEWLDRRPGYYDYGDNGAGDKVEIVLPYAWAEGSHVFFSFDRDGWWGVHVYTPTGDHITLPIRGVQWDEPLPSELFSGEAATSTWYPRQPGHNPTTSHPEREDKPENPGPLMHLSEWRALHDTGGS